MASLLYQGVRYSSSTVNNLAFGVPAVGIIAINWKRKQVKENHYGLGAEPDSRGYGQFTYEGSMTVYKDWWMSVVNAAPDKDPLKIAPFDWTIAFGNANTPFTSETLNAFEFLEDGTEVSSGDTRLKVEVPFIFAGVTRS